MTPKDKLRQYIDKWLKPLGLLWWKITIVYLDDPKELAQKEFYRDDETVLARTYSDWRYGTATIYFNMPAFDGMDDAEVENTVVHELAHILVNEMREGEMHHEERVVTGLTKAFLWTREGM